MVEIVNPQDAQRAKLLEGDTHAVESWLLAVAGKWLRQCGSCDAGLAMNCTCAAGDPRLVITELVQVCRLLNDRVELWGQRAQLLSASTQGEAYDRLEELLEQERELAKVRADLTEMRRTLRAVRTVCEADHLTQCAKDVLRLIPPRLVIEANPATTAEPAAREVTLAEAAQQVRLNLIEAEQRRIAQAEPADEPKATRCCPRHREPGEARYGCATAPGVTDPCCDQCHYWVAWNRYLDGDDEEPTMTAKTKAKCPECPGEFTTTKAGVMRWHCGTKYDGRWRQMCTGVGKRPAVLHKPWTPSSVGGTGTSSEEQA